MEKNKLIIEKKLNDYDNMFVSEILTYNSSTIMVDYIYITTQIIVLRDNFNYVEMLFDINSRNILYNFIKFYLFIFTEDITNYNITNIFKEIIKNIKNYKENKVPGIITAFPNYEFFFVMNNLYNFIFPNNFVENVIIIDNLFKTLTIKINLIKP